jgi:hypothetical protein
MYTLVFTQYTLSTMNRDRWRMSMVRVVTVDDSVDRCLLGIQFPLVGRMSRG